MKKKLHNTITRTPAIRIAILTGTVLLLSGCGAAENMPQAQTAGTITANAAQSAEEGTMQKDTITVTATSSVFVVPDRAEITVGTQTTASTAAEAQKASAEKTNRVIDKMKERGIEEKSISTQNYNMWQRYDNNGKPNGYEVSVTMTVRDQSIDEVGALIAELADAGADQFHGIRFYASTYEDAYNDAMQKALTIANGKASVFAQAAGKTLGEVHSITEGYQDMTYYDGRSFNMSLESAKAYGAAEDSLSVQPGEAEINARVTVTYRMR